MLDKFLQHINPYNLDFCCPYTKSYWIIPNKFIFGSPDSVSVLEPDIKIIEITNSATKKNKQYIFDDLTIMDYSISIVNEIENNDLSFYFYDNEKSVYTYILCCILLGLYFPFSDSIIFNIVNKIIEKDYHINLSKEHKNIIINNLESKKRFDFLKLNIKTPSPKHSSSPKGGETNGFRRKTISSIDNKRVEKVNNTRRFSLPLFITKSSFLQNPKSTIVPTNFASSSSSNDSI